ncbi:hypothetical protein CMO96_04110 [Candidatus Woesebacteria bacterium]|nr:hypothetical protein [Candidatus Woesebacteria bacterium]
MRRFTFTTVELIVIIAFFGLIVSGVILVLDPLERAKQERDNRLHKDAISLQGAIKDFFIATGKVPWANATESQSVSPALVWTPATDPKIGVCADSDCSEPGALIQAGQLYKEFFSHTSVTREQDALYVAKGGQLEDPINVCFIPDSEKTRKNVSQLYQFQPGETISPSGTPSSCFDSVSWVEEDVCYVCVPN